jgi:hypothetical protein
MLVKIDAFLAGRNCVKIIYVPFFMDMSGQC